mmetsp:Transcript_60892/g.145128  ORF Transcript_60892/g.145128 Transcript_60892/m.145128 type:complete len:241 (-) Transcript_60892:1423-2145(-)
MSLEDTSQASLDWGVLLFFFRSHMHVVVVGLRFFSPPRRDDHFLLRLRWLFGRGSALRWCSCLSWAWLRLRFRSWRAAFRWNHSDRLLLLQQFVSPWIPITRIDSLDFSPDCRLRGIGLRWLLLCGWLLLLGRRLRLSPLLVCEWHLHLRLSGLHLVAAGAIYLSSGPHGIPHCGFSSCNVCPISPLLRLEPHDASQQAACEAAAQAEEDQQHGEQPNEEMRHPHESVIAIICKDGRIGI